MESEKYLYGDGFKKLDTAIIERFDDLCYTFREVGTELLPQIDRDSFVLRYPVLSRYFQNISGLIYTS